jgi:hypothetical protein
VADIEGLHHSDGNCRRTAQTNINFYTGVITLRNRGLDGRLFVNIRAVGSVSKIAVAPVPTSFAPKTIVL